MDNHPTREVVKKRRRDVLELSLAYPDHVPHHVSRTLRSAAGGVRKRAARPNTPVSSNAELECILSFIVGLDDVTLFGAA